MAHPQGDLDWQDQGTHQFSILTQAAFDAQKSFESLTLSQVSHRMLGYRDWEDQERNPVPTSHLIHLVQRLKRLRLVLETELPPADVSDDESDEKERQWNQEQFVIEMGNSIANGALAAVLSNATELRVLELSLN